MSFIKRKARTSVGAALAACCLLVAAERADAATVLSVDGPDSGSTTLGIGLPDVGVAQSFTTTAALMDASFNFNMRCFACEGDLWLIEGTMGQNILNRQVVARTTYSFFEGVQTALANLNLLPNTYTIIMTMTSGQGLWRATDAPAITSSVATVEDGYRSFSRIDPNFLPWSTTSFVADRTLEFSINTPDDTPPVSEVPLPASAILLLAGLGGLAAFRRRAKA